MKGGVHSAGASASATPALANDDAADAAGSADAGPTTSPGLAAGPCPDGTATPADVNANFLDVNDFTTWLLETFAPVPFDQIHFPTDPNLNMSICTIQSS